MTLQKNRKMKKNPLQLLESKLFQLYLRTDLNKHHVRNSISNNAEHVKTA